MGSFIGSLSKDEIAALVAVVSATIAVIMAVVTIAYQRHRVNFAAQTLDVQQTARAGAGFFSIVTIQYLDRHFSSASPPRVDGYEVPRLRDLKGRAKKALHADPAAWARASTDADKRDWENVLAYELGIALNRIGIAVLTGVVPAGFFVTIAADQVLDDWALCREWVISYRQRESTRLQDVGAHFHRRHAEWLFLLCTLWMQKTFPNYPALAEACRNRPHLGEDFIALTMIEPTLMPNWVKAEIADMLSLHPTDLGLPPRWWNFRHKFRAWMRLFRRPQGPLYRGEA